MTDKMPKRKILTRNNVIVFAAMFTNLISDVPTPVDNLEPGYVKDEITQSSIAKRPALGTSKGKSSGDKSKLLDYERSELLASLNAAKVPFAQTAAFFKNYYNNLNEDGKITSKDLAKAAKDAKITTEQFTVVVDTLREITHDKKLNTVSRKGAKGYDYFEQPIDFNISPNGEPLFKNHVIISDLKQYNEDIKQINNAIDSSRLSKNDPTNIEAHNLMIKAFVCAETRKLIDDGMDVPNHEKLFKSFEKDLTEHNLALDIEGKIASKKETKSIELNPTYAIWNMKKGYRAAG